MPSTTTTAENATLSRIQQDIMENTRREKELQEQYQHLYNTKHPGSEQAETVTSSGEDEDRPAEEPRGITNGTTNGFAKLTNGFAKAKPQPVKASWTPLLRAISSSNLLPTQQQQSGSAFSSMPYSRRFSSTGGVRGVMEKFIKSRGKIAQVNALPINGFSTNALQSPQSIPDVETTTRITVDPTKRKFVRNNFVPIEERMKREFQEMHSREKELHEHRKSLSSLNLNEIGKDDDDSDDSDRESNYRGAENGFPMSNGMKSARSMGELFEAVQNNGHLRDREYESEDELERHEPSNLGRNRQFAKSLAQLCDAPEEELFTPGPQAVIMQFENMIRKNQQHRAWASSAADFTVMCII